MRVELPIGYYDSYHGKRYKYAKLRRLDSEDLILIGKKEVRTNPHAGLLSLGQRGVVELTNEDGSEKLEDHRNKMKFLSYEQDIIFLLMELIALVKGDKVATSYKCECGEIAEFTEVEEDGVIIDNRESIRDFKIEIMREDELDDNTFLFVAEDEEDLIVDDTFGKLDKYLFEWPTWSSYIDAWKLTDNPRQMEREIWYNSIKSVNGCSEEDLKSLKTIYGRRLLVKGIDDFARLRRQASRIGYNLQNHKVKCSCSRVINSQFDLTNFFGLILSM